jgi:hypothetical protein
MDNDTWLDDYYQQWLYDQDLIDRANDELNDIAAQQQETDE